MTPFPGVNFLETQRVVSQNGTQNLPGTWSLNTVT